MNYSNIPENMYNSQYGSYQNNQSFSQNCYGNINWNYGNAYTYSHADGLFKNVSTNYEHFGYVTNTQTRDNQYKSPGYSKPMAFISMDYNWQNYKQINSIPNLHNTMWTGDPNVMDDPIVQAVEEQIDGDGTMMTMMEQVAEMVATQPGLATMIDSTEFREASLEDIQIVEIPVAEAVGTHQGLEPTAKLKSKKGGVSRKTWRKTQSRGTRQKSIKEEISAPKSRKEKRLDNEKIVGKEDLEVIYGDSSENYRELINKLWNDEEKREAAMDLRVKFRCRRATKKAREKKQNEIVLLEKQLREKMELNEKLREEGRELERRREESKAKLNILKDLRGIKFAYTVKGYDSSLFSGPK